MSAVATATPAMSVAVPGRASAQATRKAAASATARSHTVGVELSMMAAVVVPRGESLKYNVDVTRQKTICSARPATGLKGDLAVERGDAVCHGKDRAHERADEHGAYNGDIESISRPMLAINMAMIKMHKCEPVRRAPFTKRLRIT